MVSSDDAIGSACWLIRAPAPAAAVAAPVAAEARAKKKRTYAKPYAGQSYSALLSFEQTLSQNWTFAWDTMFTRSAATTFVGKLGTTPTGGLATMGSDSAMAVSIAPAIEYNWNPSVGVIGGVWLSVAGENSEEFITPTFAVNVYE